MTTTSGAIGSHARIVNWIGDAWNEIQTAHDDWDWLRSSSILGGGISFTTTSGLATYPLGTGAGTVGVLADNFGKWDRETFRCFTTTAGNINEIFVDHVPYDTYRDAYIFGAMRQVTTRSIAFAVGPDQSINLGPPPTSQYTITGDYWQAPSLMSGDTDVPTGLPLRFHMLIVYLTMMKYGRYESAMEVYQRGMEEYNKMYSQLEAARMPKITWAGALA